jgi:hypothetical protein
MDVAKLIERLRGSDPDRVTPVDALRLHDQDPVTFPLSPEDVEGVLDLIEEVAAALETLQRERDEAREALDRANDYLGFVARWAWRESEGLTDVERLSAIKYYPPIKALGAGEPAPLSPKEAEE